jgi:hypothetical protein
MAVDAGVAAGAQALSSKAPARKVEIRCSRFMDVVLFCSGWMQLRIDVDTLLHVDSNATTFGHESCHKLMQVLRVSY